MAPIKLENHIREQLQEREIQTSDKSWEKLQQQLNTSPPKKNIRGWMYLAASLVSIAVISSLILREQKVMPDPSTTTTTTTTTTIVDVVESQKNLEIKDNVIVTNEVDKEKITLDEKVEKSNEAINVKETRIIKAQKEPIADLNTLRNNARKSKSTNDVIVVTEEVINDELIDEEIFINSKVEEVVAQINSSSSPITEEEINSLLLNAQQEIQAKKILYGTKVDAMELLSVVEDELETNFRDRVFEALGDGYEKIRTAVVERNN